MAEYSYQHAIYSDIGPSYHTNQDFADVARGGQCFALADGVGGGERGEVASRFVVDEMLKVFQHHLTRGLTDIDFGIAIKKGLQQTNTALRQLAQHCNSNMSTTIVTGCIYHDKLHYLHIGDSRLYILKNNTLTQLTQDDSLKQQLLTQYPERAQEVEKNVGSNVITQAVGSTDSPIIHYGAIDISPNDTILCTSDGAHEFLSLKRLEQELQSQKQLTTIASILVDNALSQGSKDNVSVLLLKVFKNNNTSLLKTLKNWIYTRLNR